MTVYTSVCVTANVTILFTLSVSKQYIFYCDLIVCMAKTKTLIVRISPEQDEILKVRANASGFMKKSEYVRFTLFMSMPIEEKIRKIFENECEDA